jgi:4-alpha-glucanotransferase
MDRASMSDEALKVLAARAGLATGWSDYRGVRRDVTPEALRAILRAMDLPAGTDSEIAESRRMLASATSREDSGFMTVRIGQAFTIPRPGGAARWVLEGGRTRDVRLRTGIDGMATLNAPTEPGYHTFEHGGQGLTVAVCPRRCWSVGDLARGGKPWGLAAQIYGVRDGETDGFGDFASLGRLARVAAGRGADALAISPVHALFAANPGQYAPYAPSTRLFLNVLHGDPGSGGTPPDARDSDGLIDWADVGQRRLDRLRAAHDRFRRDPGADRQAFDAFVAEGGDRLLNHARFEALDGRFRPRGLGHWRDWPDGFADVSNPATQAMSPGDPEVELHLFMQFLAARGLAKAQREAVDSGMRIGLIADLAVGMDGAGSHAWSSPRDVLTGVSVGAPPDLLGPEGQNWGLTALSPTGLLASGFSGFLATLRVAMRDAGGVRIDHAMGLSRLWVVPDGAKASEGTYLTYPFEDLLRLTALESWRHKAIVIGEDLGTVPPGFRDATTDAGILGMRVLWFERNRRNRFRAPTSWDRDAVAMSTTHDLPTIAGWWRGGDIDWRLKVDGDQDRAVRDRRGREADRAALWAVLRRTGAARGVSPDADHPEAIVDDTLKMIGNARCRLAIIPVEDALGLEEQPNLPGTIDEHPNWRRRLPPTATLTEGDAARRLGILDQARKR